ncbi:hypothetical protein [Oceanobacillus manasiensis]|uniref:hypothetical protein n=1 Tax=Oceanobacillus manasiensis TaxID=586413 RepID=UPI0005A9B19F|nr:hypothetical protein [Oceanobacillus manasiensis]
MEETFVNLLTLFVSVLFVGMAAFQVLLSFGLPLGEFAMGGYYKVLPKKLRLVSLSNAIILLGMCLVYLKNANLISGFEFLPIPILVWVISIFLGLNTIANLASRSKKERYVMTPIAGVAFVMCLLLALN